MAAVTSANVTRLRAYENGDRTGKFLEKVQTFDIVLSAQGGTTLDMPASLFGLTTIYYAYCIRAIDGSAALSWIQIITELLGVGILVCDPETATDANRGQPTNYTGTIRVVMTGI